jgi:hypothetical protein
VHVGHEHIYGRSVEVTSNFAKAHVNPNGYSSKKDTVVARAIKRNSVTVEPGKTLLVVSGLSGAIPRTWNPKRINSPLWASVVAKQVRLNCIQLQVNLIS